MIYIGIDFSVIKPSICICDENNQYHFYQYPRHIKKESKNLFEKCGIIVIEQEEKFTERKTATDTVRYDIINSNNLSDLIIDSIKPYLTKNTVIALEGSSFASTGNYVIQLATWRYSLINKLLEHISIDNIYSYSPLTVKSIAGCAKKGMNKSDMIKAFIEKGPDCQFKNYLKENENEFVKKRSKNYIDNLDDFIDAAWVLETLRIKEINFIVDDV